MPNSRDRLRLASPRRTRHHARRSPTPTAIALAGIDIHPRPQLAGTLLTQTNGTRTVPPKSPRLPVQPGSRRGSTLIVVVALLGMLSLMGFIAYTVASQEYANAIYFANAAKIREKNAPAPAEPNPPPAEQAAGQR